jgi:replicative DNA helicase
MAPNHRSDNAIENSKSIYVDLRALAQVENVVMLSAMQTNREGAKATTSRMEHAAEDFNKIRIPDLVISINRTDEERSRNEARLFFAASRNQRGDFSIHINQDLEAMNFVKSVIKIE